MKLLDFIICDDVRPELGNKLSLMGVYNSTFEISSPNVIWPFHAGFGFFIRLQSEANEVHGNEFEFHVLRKGESKVKVNGQIRLDDPEQPFAIHLNIRPFLIAEPGVLDFEIRFPSAKNPIRIPLSSLTIVGPPTRKPIAAPSAPL